MLTDIASHTAMPNTRETDKLPHVPHVVEATKDGVRVQCFIDARDPMDAIQYVQRHEKTINWKVKGE